MAICAVLLCEAAWANPAAEVAKLTTALDELDRWVGSEGNGDRWRTFLRSAELREQLAQGQEADPAAVARVLQQYKSETPGLDKQRFADVRDSLSNWLKALQRQYADDLPKYAWAARGDHRPLDDKSFAPVRDALRTRANELDNRLGSSELATGWKEYLRWPLLEQHFADDVKINRDTLEALDRVLRRLRANKPGLEHPKFVRLAEAVERYRELAFWYALGRARDTRPYYENSLRKLEKQLTRNLENPTVESSRQIGKVLGTLYQLGHTPELVDEVQQRFGQPNVLAEVSLTALQKIAARPVDEVSPVVDCILGARVRGTAFSSGVLGVQTFPADDHIEVELQLTGNIQSQTYSYKKPVRVGSLGSTSFIATKRLHITDEKFLLLPSAASAKTKTRIRSVRKTGGDFGRRIIEKIARKKVYESKGQAEYIAARHAERQLIEKFDRQVIEALSKARDNYDNKLHPPLERIGMFPDDLHMSSTSAGVKLQAKLASYKQISTDRQPPETRADNDFSVRLHQSAANNLLPHLLSGAKISQSDESEPPKIEGDVPGWLKKVGDNPKVKEQLSANADQAKASADFKPWSFLLNAEHPVSVSFADQKVTLRIRIAELKTLDNGEESVRKNWDFLVTYQITQQDNRIVLVRDGKIEVLPTDFDPVWFGDPRWDDRLTAKQVGVRKNLEENINKRAADGGGFPREIKLPPVELPGPNETKQELLLQEVNCDLGWLTLGYRMP